MEIGGKKGKIRHPFLIERVPYLLKKFFNIAMSKVHLIYLFGLDGGIDVIDC